MGKPFVNLCSLPARCTALARTNGSKMDAQQQVLYFGSAAMAIVGTVGYHTLLKQIPSSMDPIISIGAIYVGVLILGAAIAPFICSGGNFISALRHLGWVQVGIAACILMMELGFLLMYRSGWRLSTGNVVTGVAINIALMILGMLFLMEKLSLAKVSGVLMCIVGVSMIAFGNDASSAAINDNEPLSSTEHGSSGFNLQPNDKRNS